VRAFTIQLSADATVMLDEMRILHGVKPEDVIHVIVEGSLSDALGDQSLFETFSEQAVRAGANARGYWTSARECERRRADRQGTAK
jgi:hypothetical protein